MVDKTRRWAFRQRTDDVPGSFARSDFRLHIVQVFWMLALGLRVWLDRVGPRSHRKRSSMAKHSESSPSIVAPEGFDLQGHRGARGLAPENTIPSFRRALEIGVTTLEMDVVLSGDGEVVVSHEPWMSHEICSKPSGAPVVAEEERALNLFEMTYAEIAQYDCGRRGHPDFPDQGVQPAVKPRFREVVEMAEEYTREHDRAPVFYNVEIKSRRGWGGVYHPEPEAYAQKVLVAVREAGITGRTTIQSFDRRILRVARRLEAERGGEYRARFALLVGRIKPGGLSRHVSQLGFTPDVYSPNYRRVNERLVRQAHERSIWIVPWTVNDREVMRRLIQVGVHGLITDYPDVGLDVVRDWEGSSN